MSDAAVAGGVQRCDSHAGIVLGNHEHRGAGIGFGRHQECIGDGSVEHLRPRAGQPVCGAVGGRLYGTFAHIPVECDRDDLVTVDRRRRPRLLQVFGAELGERACGEYGRFEVGHRCHLSAERDQHGDLLQTAESAAAQRLRCGGGQDVGVAQLGPQLAVEAFVEPVELTLPLGCAHRLGDGAHQTAQVVGGFSRREIHG